jgi:hypothetical protein
MVKPHLIHQHPIQIAFSSMGERLNAHLKREMTAYHTLLLLKGIKKRLNAYMEIQSPINHINRRGVV